MCVFPLTTLAVSVCARYLPCNITTLVLSDKCSHCTCTLSALFSKTLGAVKGSCLCVCTLFALFPHNVGAVTQMQSMYMHAICSRLVLSDKPVSVCEQYLFQACAVRYTSLCVCTLFVPSWCCQINQSLYVHIICCVLSQRCYCQTSQFLCPPFLLCPLTTLVLSDKPVSLCARYLLSSHNVGAVRRSCLCTARVLFFTTG